MDGPVVLAAIRALQDRDVDVVLPYVPPEGEGEVRDAFGLVLAARDEGPTARRVADRSFFETVVRIHRAGEGAPFTGVKPAGLPVGPVIPAAERAIASGSPDSLLYVLEVALRHEVKERLERVLELEIHAEGPVPEAREYVSAMLGLQVWAHRVHDAIRSRPHGSRQRAHAG
jgi:hypothetical protein